MSNMEPIEHNQHEMDGKLSNATPMSAPPSLLPNVLQQLGLQGTSAVPTQADTLVQALYHPEWRIRAAAVRKIGQLGSHTPLDPLLIALHDEHVSVRVTAVHALGQLGLRMPVERVLAMLHDEEWQVREAAVFSLGTLGKQIPTEPLLAVLQDTDMTVREAAKQTLQQIWLATSADDTRSQKEDIQSNSLSTQLFKSTFPSTPKKQNMRETDVQPGEYIPVPQSNDIHPVLSKKRSRLWGRTAVSVAVLFVLVNVVAWTFIVQHLRPNRPNTSIVGSGPNSPVPSTHPANAPTPTPPFAPTPTVALTGSVGTTLYNYSCQMDSIHSLAWSPDGSRIGSTCSDATARDAKTGKHVFSYEQSSGSVLSIAWSPDGTRIEASSQTVKVWNATTGSLLVEFAPQTKQAFVPSTHANPLTQTNPQSGGNFVYSSAWSPNGSLVASSVDGLAYGYEVQVWNSQTGQLAFKLQPNANPTPSDYIESVNWSPDGKYISFMVDRSVEVWSVATKKLVTTHDGGGNSAWSPDSKLIVSTEANGSVAVWNAVTGVIIYTYHGHMKQQFGGATTVAWSSDGRRIASGGSDVQVWDATTGKNVYVYKGHGTAQDTSISALAWSPDSKYIASGDNIGPYGGHVRVWKAV